MIANRILLATLGIMLCSFFPRGAQQSDEPLPLLPSPQNLGTAPVTEPAPLQISPTPTVFPPAKVGGVVTQNKSPLTFSSELGSQWDRCYQELQAQDEEIKKAEEHLVQLRNQRRIRAEKLAEIAKRLAPLVAKAQENSMDAKPLPPASRPKGQDKQPQSPAPTLQPPAGLKLIPNQSKAPNQGVDSILNKLESIEKRLATVEQTRTNPVLHPPVASEIKSFTRMLPDGRTVTTFHRKPARVAIWLLKSPEHHMFSENSLHKLELMLRKTVELNCKDNREDVSLVPVAEIQNLVKTLSSKPLTKQEICQLLNADYLIQVELSHFSTYLSGSANTLHQGRAEIELTISSPRGGGDVVKHQEVFSHVFPEQPIDATNGNPGDFEQKFMKVISQQVCLRLENCPGSEKAPVKTIQGKLGSLFDSTDHSNAASIE